MGATDHERIYISKGDNPFPKFFNLNLIYFILLKGILNNDIISYMVTICLPFNHWQLF